MSSLCISLSFSDPVYRASLFTSTRVLHGAVGSRGVNKRSYEFDFPLPRFARAAPPLQERSLRGQTSRVQVAGVWWSAALRGACSSAGAPAARWGLTVRAGVGGGESELVKIHGGGFASREAAVRRDSSCHAVVYQSILTIGYPLLISPLV